MANSFVGSTQHLDASFSLKVSRASAALARLSPDADANPCSAARAATVVVTLRHWRLAGVPRRLGRGVAQVAATSHTPLVAFTRFQAREPHPTRLIARHTTSGHTSTPQIPKSTFPFIRNLEKLLLALFFRPPHDRHPQMCSHARPPLTPGPPDALDTPPSDSGRPMCQEPVSGTSLPRLGLAWLPGLSCLSA